MEKNVLIPPYCILLASLIKMSLFHWCFFTHFASKNQLPGFYKQSIGYKLVNACLEIPFTKNFDGLKTSLLFYIENHWTGFCVIRVFPKRCFGTEYRKFVNVSRSVSGIHLFRCECNLVVFFFFLKSHVQNVTFGKLPFYLLWPKNVS